jgi:hypothetical protein
VFEPVTIDNVFDKEDLLFLRLMLADKDKYYRYFYDNNCKRHMGYLKVLEGYFGKKLEPLARKIFKDDTLQTTFGVYCRYDSPESFLPEHKDKHACTYNISYCLSQDKPWYLKIDGKLYQIDENELVAYSGTDSVHGRGPMRESENSEVEMLFFHFAPKDSWYFDHCEDFRLDYDYVPTSN